MAVVKSQHCAERYLERPGFQSSLPPSQATLCIDVCSQLTFLLSKQAGASALPASPFGCLLPRVTHYTSARTPPRLAVLSARGPSTGPLRTDIWAVSRLPLSQRRGGDWASACAVHPWKLTLRADRQRRLDWPRSPPVAHPRRDGGCRLGSQGRLAPLDVRWRRFPPALRPSSGPGPKCPYGMFYPPSALVCSDSRARRHHRSQEGPGGRGPGPRPPHPPRASGVAWSGRGDRGRRPRPGPLGAASRPWPPRAVRGSGVRGRGDGAPRRPVPGPRRGREFLHVPPPQRRETRNPPPPRVRGDHGPLARPARGTEAAPGPRAPACPAPSPRARPVVRRRRCRQKRGRPPCGIHRGKTEGPSSRPGPGPWAATEPAPAHPLPGVTGTMPARRDSPASQTESVLKKIDAGHYSFHKASYVALLYSGAETVGKP